MPRKHVRSTDKGSWTEEQISEALNCIKNGEKVRAVGRKFGINESTLRRRLKLGITGGPSMGRKAVFTKEEEEEIGYLFLLLTKLFYKVTLIELRRMAFKYAEMKNIKHNFNRQTELAGKDWAMSFMKRNPQLSIHKSEPTLIDRDIPFDETETSLYLNLKTLMEKCNILPSHTSSVDQTDVITDQNSFIIDPKDQIKEG